MRKKIGYDAEILLALHNNNQEITEQEIIESKIMKEKNVLLNNTFTDDSNLKQKK